MTDFYFRSAVSPLRREFPAGGTPLPTVDSVIAAARPSEPLHCLRPALLTATADRFVTAFPGTVLYAVKCNPEPRVLRALWAGGVRHFDCASPAEVRLIRQMFDGAAIHYMHPVKSRAAIREAARVHGVVDFALDSADELAKILTEAGGTASGRLGLFVRLAVTTRGAAYDLSGKFGAEPQTAAAILAAARPHAARLGICFHVGSQCLEPAAYAAALAQAADVIARAGVAIDVIDVGGGFPVAYAGVSPPPLAAFVAAIETARTTFGLAGTALWAEPGRALVAAGASVVTHVELRRDDALYINDGTYGSLFDAGTTRVPFPVRLIRPDGPPPAAELRPFRLFGPTCDSADRMDGPFWLPADTGEGDWIEIGQLGAYGGCLRTAFNGFDRARLIEVADGPLLAEPG